MRPGTPAERLAALLRIPTVSAPGERDEAAFTAFRDALEALYPRVHADLERSEVAGGARHLVWRGGDGPAIVLMAHYDVVPVTGQRWRHDPFAGVVEDGVVHGRGALDDKGPLVVILEAVESLLADGVRPSGDVHLVLGHDEEVMGSGAQAVAAALAASGIRPQLVLDEGGAVVEGVLPGVRGPLAVIGVTEKGLATIRLTVAADGGHAAVPPRRQAAVRLARALTRIDRRGFPARTGPVLAATAVAVTPRLPRPIRPLIPVLRPALGPLAGVAGGIPAALARTTVAVTGLEAGVAPNVLASSATALLNLRIAPGESVAGTVARLRRIIADRDVAVEVVDAHEPSPVSRNTGPAWRRVTAALSVAYPEALAVPYCMVQASDARHFTGLDADVYRFMPFAISARQLAAVHGPDENVDVVAIEAGIAFHRALIAG